MAVEMFQTFRWTGPYAFSWASFRVVPLGEEDAQDLATARFFVRLQALAACGSSALEWYRLATGRFPDKLDALAPRFITQLPHDGITGEPYQYRRTAFGQFVLTPSVGHFSPDWVTVNVSPAMVIVPVRMLVLVLAGIA